MQVPNDLLVEVWEPAVPTVVSHTPVIPIRYAYGRQVYIRYDRYMHTVRLRHMSHVIFEHILHRTTWYTYIYIHCKLEYTYAYPRAHLPRFRLHIRAISASSSRSSADHPPALYTLRCRLHKHIYIHKRCKETYKQQRNRNMHSNR